MREREQDPGDCDHPLPPPHRTVVTSHMGAIIGADCKSRPLQEHPYYASFGYHVSSFFAASSRCATGDPPAAAFPAAAICTIVRSAQRVDERFCVCARSMCGNVTGALSLCAPVVCGEQLRGSGLAQAAHRCGARLRHLGAPRHRPLPRSASLRLPSFLPLPPPLPLLLLLCASVSAGPGSEGNNR